jgi:Tfp pilus assembly protein PilZ
VRIDAAYSSGDQTHKGQVNNVSAGGAFLVTPAPPPVGTDLKITLALPGEEAEQSLEARVVRVVEMHGERLPDHVQGMGLEFKLTEEQRERLRKILLTVGSEDDEKKDAPPGGPTGPAP